MKIVVDISVTSGPFRAGRPWHPMALFAGGSKGACFLPANLSSLFQDAAASIPVTAPGQGVGRMTDLSGRGLDATQSGNARPILAVEPATGRINLSPLSEPLKADLSLATGVLDAATGLPGFDATIQVPGGTVGNRFVYRDHGAEPSTEYTLSCFIAMDDGGAPNPGADFNIVIGNASVGVFSAPVDLGNNVWRISKTATSNSAGNMSNTGLVKSDTHSIRGLRVTGWQLERGAVMTAYQKARSAYNLSEAGVPSVYALDFDGVDDLMLTGTLDLTHTSQVTIIAAVKKYSNPTVRGTIVNFVDNGFHSFTLEVPQPTVHDTRWFHVGNSVLRAVGHTLPIGARVLYTGTSDIAAPRLELRANGGLVDASIDSTGGGVFKSGPLGIGDYVTPGGRNFHGRLYGLLVIDRVLTAPEIAKAEAWMAGKAGMVV